MAEVDVFVWYDSDGNITAIGTPHPDRVASVHPIAAKVNVECLKMYNLTIVYGHLLKFVR